jgi:hypothetical protein
MHLRYLLLFATLLMATFGQAQTRKLAHRSHSGSPNTFAMLMDEDHGGGPVPEKIQETYYLEPWIIKIRKHYEEVAKQKGPNVEVKKDERSQDPSPTEQKATPQDSVPQKTQSKPRTGTQTASSSLLLDAQPTTTSAEEIPRIRLAKATVAPAHQEGNSIWLLAGIIFACVVPCVFLLSSRRKNNP